MDNKKNYILELSGLPGSGKSTLSKNLNNSLKNQSLIYGRKFSQIKFKYLLSLPFVPYILIRFYRVIWALFIAKIHSFNGDVSFRVIFGIIFTLSASVMEYRMSCIECLLKNKIPLIDGGYIQWGISIWLRSPPEIKNEIWSAYLTHMPKNILCIILNCDSSEALKRAHARVEGVPNVINSRPWASRSPEYLNKQYNEINNLLNSYELRSIILDFDCSSNAPTSEQVDLTCRVLKDFVDLEKIVIS
jgi:energy-coupling factor transporter ATP-binding protein EcfA2